MNQIMRRRNEIEYLVLKPIEAWNVYNMILMYITLFTNEHTRLRLICLFGFTVDNGGSPKTKRISNKISVLKYY